MKLSVHPILACLVLHKVSFVATGVNKHRRILYITHLYLSTKCLVLCFAFALFFSVLYILLCHYRSGVAQYRPECIYS